jgi:type IV pilus assembly protein PilQ
MVFQRTALGRVEFPSLLPQTPTRTKVGTVSANRSSAGRTVSWRQAALSIAAAILVQLLLTATAIGESAAAAGAAPGDGAAAKLADKAATTKPAIVGDSAAAPTTAPAVEDPKVVADPKDSASAGKAAPADSVKAVRPGTFEIHVQGADLRGVLQLLSTQGRKNIIATKEVTGSVTADLYDVTFREALEAVLRASGYVYEEKGSFVYVYTPKQLEDFQKTDKTQSVRMFRLSYITAADAKTLITPALSPDGNISLTPPATGGVAPSTVEAGGQSYSSDDVIIVRDYEKNIKSIEKLITDLDVKPDQVMIDTTLLRATLTEENSLGIDLDVLGGINFGTLTSPTSTGSSSGGSGGSGGTTATLGSDLGGTSLATATGTGMTTGILQGNLLNSPAVKVSTGGGGLALGFVSDNVALFIHALETVTDVTVMANPKLLVLNRQRGEVLVGNRDGYLTTTVTETVSTQAVQFLETGTKLIVRPFIARDGFIRMEIHPEDSSGSVKLVAGSTSVLPSETTTEVTSNVLVRDGRTIVIGGLFREVTTSTRSQVPILGNVPCLGVLFRNTDDNTVREEVIALITPHIVKQAVDEAVGEQMKDDAERFRVGQRKGMMWWGRDRLAQLHLGWAKQWLCEGNREKALWDVDMALSLSPRMDDAIKMKERLTQKAYWSDESRTSSVKNVLEKMVCQDLGLPVDRVIDPNKPRNGEVTPAAKDVFGIQGRPEDSAKTTYHPPLPLKELIPLEDAKPPQGDDMCPPVMQDPCGRCGVKPCHVSPDEGCQTPVDGAPKSADVVGQKPAVVSAPATPTSGPTPAAPCDTPKAAAPKTPAEAPAEAVGDKVSATTKPATDK